MVTDNNAIVYYIFVIFRVSVVLLVLHVLVLLVLVFQFTSSDLKTFHLKTQCTNNTIDKITNILINHRKSLEYKIHTIAPFLFKFINGL